MMSGISIPTSMPVMKTNPYRTRRNGPAACANTMNSRTAEKPPMRPMRSSIWMKRAGSARSMNFDSHEPTPMANR